MSGGGGGSGPGAPLWIVSFSDMIANLVTFFIVLATFNAANPKGIGGKTYLFDEPPGAFGGKGRAPKPSLVQREGDTSSRFGLDGPETPSRRREKDLEATLDRLVQGPEFSVKPALERLKDGLRITLAASGLYAPGSARLGAQGREILVEIGNFLRGEECQVVIEAHTDDRTWTQTPVASDLDFTRAMAVAAAGILVEECRFPPPRVGIMPCGSQRPADSNDTATGRSRNRRIVIVAGRRP